MNLKFFIRSCQQGIILFLMLFVPSDLTFSNALASEKLKPEESSYLDNIITESSYILGAGDVIYLTIAQLEELNQYLKIGPDGTIRLIQLGDVIAEGYTLDELKDSLVKAYSKYIKSPILTIRMIDYRPVNVYIAGEVSRPGMYTIKNNNNSANKSYSEFLGPDINKNDSFLSRDWDQPPFPTLYSAIKMANGVNVNSDLSNITIIRKNTISNGGGRKKATLNFLSLFLYGDQSKNIRIFDGDTILIPKSDKMISEQIDIVNSSNLSSDFIQVYISGNIKKPGPVTIPKGSGLTQAISSTGGVKVLSGNVQFLRFTNSGLVDKRKFIFKQDADLKSYKNPVLMSGDIINVEKNLLGKTANVAKEFTSPILGMYSLFKIVN